jgi:hypothetical protein
MTAGTATKSFTMDIPELAELIGCGTTPLYDDARDGYIEVANGEYVRVMRRGRRVFVSRAAVMLALEKASA